MEYPTGNYYDKYNSKNKIEQMLMQGFFKSLSECLDVIDFENVLEAGCGEGEVINYISRLPKFSGRGILEAFDIGKEEICKAKESFPHITFFEKSIYESGYKDNSFDLVVCCEVLEHVTDYEKALK